MKKTPRRTTFDRARVKLSRLEDFVLSRIDGQLSVKDIVQLTGLAAPQVEQIMAKLETHGAIEVGEAASEPQLEELLAGDPIADPKDVVDEVPGAIPEPPTSWIVDEMPGSSRGQHVADQLAAFEAHDSIGTLEPISSVALETIPLGSDGSSEQLEELEQVTADDDLAVPVERNVASPVAAAEGDTPTEEADANEQPKLVPAEGDVTDPDEVDPALVQNYRKLYETTLKELPVAERVKKAQTEAGATLFALCFDQDVTVVKAVLENDRMGLDHARLIAQHHHNAAGLEAICRRVSLVKDARVQRMLLRNVQLPEMLMKKILMPKRLLEIYKASNDRDIPDRTRSAAKSLFRSKFAVATSEEKFELIWNTEGRVLPHLTGQTIDQKTSSMFQARNFTSIMLIQAFARFPATPPGILAHMLKQPLVKRQAHLRNMILQHPNVPSEAKMKR